MRINRRVSVRYAYPSVESNDPRPSFVLVTLRVRGLRVTQAGIELEARPTAQPDPLLFVHRMTTTRAMVKAIELTSSRVARWPSDTWPPRWP